MWAACCPILFQSTHPRGVRRGHGRWVRIREMFQSTHPRGVRRISQEAFACIGAGFQSTHPRGVRRWAFRPRPSLPACFNPRTRVGCDTPPCSVSRTNDLFQSTHPRGVRRGKPCSIYYATRAFQSTHPRGVRRSCPPSRRPGRAVSIHAPAWGATVSMFYPVDSRD